MFNEMPSEDNDPFETMTEEEIKEHQTDADEEKKEIEEV